VTRLTSGKQTPERFEGGLPQVLEFSFNLLAFGQAALKLTSTQTSEERLEVNWAA
jgi:hypothetical protein